MTSSTDDKLSGRPLLEFAIEAAGGLFNSRLRANMRHFQMVASTRQQHAVFPPSGSTSKSVKQP